MSTRSIQPLGDRLIIKVAEAETRTKSGLYLPTQSQEKPAEGVVVAVGDGERISKSRVAVGSCVMFQKFAGIEAEIEGVKHLILSDVDVIGIIHELG